MGENKKSYCCYYIIPSPSIGDYPIKVFICGVCKRELSRYAMDGIPRTLILLGEECCGDQWQIW